MMLMHTFVLVLVLVAMLLLMRMLMCCATVHRDMTWTDSFMRLDSTQAPSQPYPAFGRFWLLLPRRHRSALPMAIGPEVLELLELAGLLSRGKGTVQVYATPRCFQGTEC